MAARQYRIDEGQGGWFKDRRPHHDAALKGMDKRDRHLPVNRPTPTKKPEFHVESEEEYWRKVKRLHDGAPPGVVKGGLGISTQEDDIEHQIDEIVGWKEEVGHLTDTQRDRLRELHDQLRKVRETRASAPKGRVPEDLFKFWAEQAYREHRNQHLKDKIEQADKSISALQRELEKDLAGNHPRSAAQDRRSIEHFERSRLLASMGQFASESEDQAVRYLVSLDMAKEYAQRNGVTKAVHDDNFWSPKQKEIVRTIINRK